MGLFDVGMIRDKLGTELGFRVGISMLVFRVGLSSWTFELDFRVGLSSLDLELDFPAGSLG